MMPDARSPTVSALPPGQFEVPALFRFGTPAFADRLPRPPLHTSLAVTGAVVRPSTIDIAELQALPRRDVTADFHCVTTWSVRDLRWSGLRLVDVVEMLIVPRSQPAAGAGFLRFTCADGPSVCIDRRDLERDDVILADRLNGAPLPLEHGAPLRLIAPHLYGYKNPKHINGIEFRADYRRGTAERITGAHPRGRVAFEERGRFLPGFVYRYVYRAFIASTKRTFERAAAAQALDRRD